MEATRESRQLKSDVSIARIVNDQDPRPLVFSEEQALRSLDTVRLQARAPHYSCCSARSSWNECRRSSFRSCEL